ncbi:MAG: hypothetical protein WBM43_13145 [Flavobacteriaceae bacterium]
MKAEQDKKADEFISKLMAEAGPDKPSDRFTQSIMEKIGQEQSHSSVTLYKPLISKKAWLPISIVIFGICFIFLKGDWKKEWLELPVPFLDEIAGLFQPDRFDALIIMDSINIYHTVLYALLILSIFFYIQIIYLKRYL